MWRVDQTLDGATIRVARLMADKLLIEIVKVEIPESLLDIAHFSSKAVKNMVLMFCNLSFDCEIVKVEIPESLLDIAHFSSRLLVKKRTFIPIK